MLSKNYCLNAIKLNKIVDSKEEKLASGLIELTIRLYAVEQANMTINDLSKQLTALATTVDKGFKQVDDRLNNIDNRLGNLEVKVNKLETEVAKHSDIFKQNGLK